MPAADDQNSNRGSTVLTYSVTTTCIERGGALSRRRHDVGSERDRGGVHAESRVRWKVGHRTKPDTRQRQRLDMQDAASICVRIKANDIAVS